MKWSGQLECEVRVQSVLWGWKLPKMHCQRDPLAAATGEITVFEAGGYGLFGNEKFSISFVSGTFVLVPYLRNVLTFLIPPRMSVRSQPICLIWLTFLINLNIRFD